MPYIKSHLAYITGR